MWKKKSFLSSGTRELEAWLAYLDILIDSPPQWSFLRQTPSSPARIPAKGNHILLTPAGTKVEGGSKKHTAPKTAQIVSRKGQEKTQSGFRAAVNARESYVQISRES